MSASEPNVIGLRARVSLLVAALLVGAGVCEIAARLIFPAPQNPWREPRILFQTLPGVGFVHLPNQQAWMDDGFVHVNSLGLRGPEPENPRPPGALRVLAVGDSTTFGLGVSDAETYVARLDARLRAIDAKADAVNGGISGYNLALDISLIKHFSPILRPDVVLVGFFWNDLPYEASTPDGTPLQVADSSPTAVRKTERSTATVEPEAPRTFRIGEPPSRLNRLLRSSRLLYVIRQNYLGSVTPTATGRNTVEWEVALLEGRKSGAIDAAWATVGISLADVAAFGREHGIDVGLVVMPIRAQVEGEFAGAAYQTRAAALAREAGLFVIDPLPAFRAQVDRAALFIPYDRMHYSARGNDVLAQAVFDGLRDRPSLSAAAH